VAVLECEFSTIVSSWPPKKSSLKNMPGVSLLVVPLAVGSKTLPGSKAIVPQPRGPLPNARALPVLSPVNPPVVMKVASAIPVSWRPTTVSSVVVVGPCCTLG
jgi:hypothetical protein